MASERLSKLSKNPSWELIEKYQEALFKLYIGDDFSYFQAFRSPLREDNNPSCCMYWAEDNNAQEILKMNDFGGKKYNIVEFVMEYEKSQHRTALTYQQATDFIVSKLIPKLDSTSVKDKLPIKKDKHCLIKNSNLIGVTMARFLESTLKSYKIAPIEAFQLGFDTYVCNEAYAYRSPDGGLKIYQPQLENNTGKWILINQSSFYDGEWLLEPKPRVYDCLFITTSRKDSCVIYECLHAAINPFNTEKEIIDVKDLRNKYNFNKIFYVKDNDKTGDEIAKIYESLGCIIISVPEGKDPYEFISLSNFEEFVEWLNSCIWDNV
jgi:hypothetical protein